MALGKPCFSSRGLQLELEGSNLWCAASHYRYHRDIRSVSCKPDLLLPCHRCNDYQFLPDFRLVDKNDGLGMGWVRKFCAECLICSHPKPERGLDHQQSGS